MNESITTTLAENVLKARKALGWSQVLLAARSGLGRNTIARMEDPDADKTVLHVQMVANALGTTAWKLLK